MKDGKLQILLAARDARDIFGLAEQLQRMGCECHIVTSNREARCLGGRNSFDLLLSETTLSDGSAYHLIAFLLGSHTSLFFFLPLHHDCLWLPALDRGQHCFGSRALGPSEFSKTLVAILRERAPIGSSNSSSAPSPSWPKADPSDEENNGGHTTADETPTEVLCGGGRALRYCAARADPTEGA